MVRACLPDCAPSLAVAVGLGLALGAVRPRTGAGGAGAARPDDRERPDRPRAGPRGGGPAVRSPSGRVRTRARAGPVRRPARPAPSSGPPSSSVGGSRRGHGRRHRVRRGRGGRRRPADRRGRARRRPARGRGPGRPRAARDGVDQRPAGSSYTWPYIDLIRLPRAWDVSTGSGRRRRGPRHRRGRHARGPDRVAAARGSTWSTATATTTDPHGHGTLVAGIVAARGNNGRGVGRRRVRREDPAGPRARRAGNGTDETIAEGIRLGRPQRCRRHQPVARRSRGLPAAAVGDRRCGRGRRPRREPRPATTGTEAPFFPAAYAPQIDGLLAVGATDDDGALTSFSSWGNWVSLTAPGWSIIGPQANGTYVAGSGTSMAAPQVSGAAALMLARTPGRTPAQVEDVLLSTARDAGPRGVDAYYGYGVLDAASAVTARDSVRAAVAVPLDRALDTPGGDDTAARARSVASGTEGTLSPEGDVDWYRIAVPSAGWYDVRVDLPYATGGREPRPRPRGPRRRGSRARAGRRRRAERRRARRGAPPPRRAASWWASRAATGHASDEPYRVVVTRASQQVWFARNDLPGAPDTRDVRGRRRHG